MCCSDERKMAFYEHLFEHLQPGFSCNSSINARAQ